MPIRRRHIAHSVLVACLFGPGKVSPAITTGNLCWPAKPIGIIKSFRVAIDQNTLCTLRQLMTYSKGILHHQRHRGRQRCILAELPNVGVTSRHGKEVPLPVSNHRLLGQHSRLRHLLMTMAL